MVRLECAMAAPYFSVWHAKNKEKKHSTGLFKTNNANDVFCQKSFFRNQEIRPEENEYLNIQSLIKALVTGQIIVKR